MSLDLSEKPNLSVLPERKASGIMDRVARRLVHVGKTYLNVLITLSGRTHTRRWRQVANEIPPWDDRNLLIASLVPDGSSVVDLGSGAMTLRAHLKPACTYQPCDVVQSAPDVLLCNFNTATYPNLTKQYDYVVCSGVLEYVADVPDFLTRVSNFGKTVLLTYNPRIDGQTRVYRMSNNWVNGFTKDELEDLFHRAGLKQRVLDVSPHHELLYELTKSPSQPTSR